MSNKIDGWDCFALVSLQNMQDYITRQEELEKINTELNKKVEEFETLQNNQTDELNEMLKKIQSTEITMEDCRKENVKLKSKIDELSNECRNLDIQQTVMKSLQLYCLLLLLFELKKKINFMLSIFR